ncbi:hypothetical protein [Micromonospora maritima]|uniref:hypothetical protein n=1 Tax=Micromonospora maritima TaxID=986711 RepID=UPI0037B814D9
MALTNPTAGEEQRALVADMAAQERAPGGTALAAPRTSPGYVRGTSPDGELVTFVPGETLPAWAVAALADGRGVYDGTGNIWTITDAPPVDDRRADTAADLMPAPTGPPATADTEPPGIDTEQPAAEPVGEADKRPSRGRRS